MWAASMAYLTCPLSLPLNRSFSLQEQDIARGGEDALTCILCCESYCSPTARSFELFLPDGTRVRSKTDTSHSVGHEFLSAPISRTAIKTYHPHQLRRRN